MLSGGEIDLPIRLYQSLAVPSPIPPSPQGVACQRSDWPSHKAACRAADGKWYDAHRKCEDGSSHFGALELITWKGPAPPELELGEGLGWGSCLASEGPGLRRRYEGDEFGGDDAKFYEYRPGAYRYVSCVCVCVCARARAHAYRKYTDVVPVLDFRCCWVAKISPRTLSLIPVN